MEEETKGMESENRVYELGFLFVPTIPEENIAGEFTALKDVIEASGAKVISEEMPRYMELAYTMERVIANKTSKFGYGYFGWIKFELDPASLVTLKEACAMNEKLIRFLLVKTVRESTLASKKSFTGAGAGSKKRAPAKAGEAPVEINKEEIDREIDAMVAPDVVQ